MEYTEAARNDVQFMATPRKLQDIMINKVNEGEESGDLGLQNNFKRECKILKWDINFSLDIRV